MIHLYMNSTYDESDTWCDADSYAQFKDGGGTNDPSRAECKACLIALIQYAHKAHERLKHLGDKP